MTELEFEAGNSKNYKVKAIQNSAVYTKTVERLSIRILLFDNIKKLSEKRKYVEARIGCTISLKFDQFVVQKILQKANSNFSLINIFPPIARPTIKPTKSIK